jgi:hypothetical protein
MTHDHDDQVALGSEVPGNGTDERHDETTLGLYRCKVCGTAWLLWPDVVNGGGWNLLDKYQRPGECCDNVQMGAQIEHLRDIPLTVTQQAAHNPFDDVISNGGLPEARAFYRDERIRALEQAIGNCYMMAKRQVAAHLNGTNAPAKDLERWQHVQRFCETTGIKSSILRWQLPTEITGG